MTDKLILVADNSFGFRNMVATLLQRKGYNLALACNGTEAIQLCLSRRPDLILLDYDLNDIPGPVLCQTLKGNPLSANIPILFFASRQNNGEEMIRAIESGGLEYLSKPIDSQVLLDKVMQYLDRLDIMMGKKVSIEPPGILGEVIAFSNRRIAIASKSNIEKLVKTGDEVELIYKDERSGNTFRHTVTRLERHEQKTEAFWFSLIGGIYRTQRRQFIRKEIQLPLRYRLEGDFYRVGFAANISGGGLHIENVARSAYPGQKISIELRLPDLKEPIPIQGEIVRIVPQSDETVAISVSFKEISPLHQTSILMFALGDAAKEK